MIMLPLHTRGGRDIVGAHAGCRQGVASMTVRTPETPREGPGHSVSRDFGLPILAAGLGKC